MKEFKFRCIISWNIYTYIFDWNNNSKIWLEISIENKQLKSNFQTNMFFEELYLDLEKQWSNDVDGVVSIIEHAGET